MTLQFRCPDKTVPDKTVPGKTVPGKIAIFCLSRDNNFPNNRELIIWQTYALIASDLIHIPNFLHAII